MSENTPAESRGLLESLSAMAATLVAIAHTRLDLLSADLDEGRARVLSLLALALAALFFIGVGVVLAAILLVAAFWDSYRLLALGSLAGVFLAAGAGVWAYALHKAKTKPRLFAASLSELLKDRQQLVSRPKDDHEQKTDPAG